MNSNGKDSSCGMETDGFTARHSLVSARGMFPGLVLSRWPPKATWAHLRL